MRAQEFLENNKHKIRNDSEYSVCCPFCYQKVGKVDTKYKMGLSLSKNVAHCFRCGTTIRFNDKIDDNLFVYIKDTKLSDISNKLKSVSFNKKININQNINKEIINLDVISQPVSKDITPFAYEYLKSRDLLDYVDSLNIRVGKKYIDDSGKIIGVWEGRVIFPVYSNGEVVFLIGRSYIGSEPKYLNSRGDKSSFLYTVGKNDDDSCILCEGIISAISANKYTNINSIVLLGKFPSEYQLYLIQQRYKRVYYSLDGDVDKKIKTRILTSLYKLGLDVYVIELPKDKDPNDLGHLYLNYFNSAKKYL